MGKNILVIEPDEVKYATLEKMLADLNYAEEHIFRGLSFPDSFSIPLANVSVIIASLGMNSESDVFSVRRLVSHFVHIPVIVVSGNDDNRAYIDAIHEGAQDLLVNGQFDSRQLGRAICIAFERTNLKLEAENTFYEYKRHFDNGPLPMWIFNEKTLKYLVVNQAAIAKYGYNKEEFSQMSILDIRPAEDVAAMLETFNHRKDDYYDAGYWRHKKKNGEVFYVHMYSHATLFEGIPARLCFAVDVNSKMITDMQNRELNALIKEQKEQLDNILLSISDAIWSRRTDTMELTYANNAYYKLFGCEPGKARSQEEVVEAVYPDDRHLMMAAVDEVKETGSTEFAYRYYNVDGSLKTLKVSSRLKKGEDGQPDMINGITIDITKEKELYDAIRNNEQKLSATINNTKDLIWSVDANLRIIFCNKPYQDFFYKLIGIALDEGDYVLGNWHSEEFINSRKKDYDRAFRGESFTVVIEENYNDANLYFEISSNPIVDVDGKIVGVNCISRDISEQRSQLLKIQEQNARLKEIAWIQSHKVRGPVASILGLISLVDYELIAGENNVEVLENLKTATHDLDLVIREVVEKTNDLKYEQSYLSSK